MKEFAKEYGFNYVHELYYGEFISWEHCFSFANSPMYGEQQEGIAILQKVGEHGGKLCSKVTMEIIKKKLGV